MTNVTAERSVSETASAKNAALKLLAFALIAGGCATDASSLATFMTVMEIGPAFPVRVVKIGERHYIAAVDPRNMTAAPIAELAVFDALPHGITGNELANLEDAPDNNPEAIKKATEEAIANGEPPPAVLKDLKVISIAAFLKGNHNTRQCLASIKGASSLIDSLTA